MFSFISLKRCPSPVTYKRNFSRMIDSRQRKIICWSHYLYLVLRWKILMFPWGHSCELMPRNAFFCAGLMQRSCICFDERSRTYFLDTCISIFFNGKDRKYIPFVMKYWKFRGRTKHYMNRAQNEIFKCNESLFHRNFLSEILLLVIAIYLIGSDNIR